MMDSKAIIETISAIFSGADERNWQKVESSFAEKVLLDYTSMQGGEPATVTPEDITTAWKALLPGFDSTRHNISDYNIKISGNEATVTANGKASHYLAVNGKNEEWVVEGNYLFSLKKENGDWKVSSMKFNKEKISGNTQLPDIAKENVKKGTSGSTRKCKFNSEGLILVGTLHLPNGFSEKSI